jgi:hypothetical protein
VFIDILINCFVPPSISLLHFHAIPSQQATNKNIIWLIIIWQQQQQQQQQQQNAAGNGTSMITLAIPPKDQISRVNKMLTEE